MSIYRTKQHKTALRASLGYMLLADRGSGKSTAILEVIHDDHAGHAALVVLSRDAAQHFRCEYAALYPYDALPHIVPKEDLGLLRGIKAPVYSDEAYLGPYEQALLDFRGGLTSVDSLWMTRR